MDHQTVIKTLQAKLKVSAIPFHPVLYCRRSSLPIEGVLTHLAGKGLGTHGESRGPGSCGKETGR